MAKVTKENLTRGVKLTTQHVFTPLTAIETELEDVNIEADQVNVEGGSFRVNLNIPCIDSSAFPTLNVSNYSEPLRIEHSIPFTLPPLQAFFDERGTTGVPSLVLEEFSFSFDQRAEPAAIADYFFKSGGDEGKRDGYLNYEHLDAYEIEVALVEKPVIAKMANAGYVPQREIFSVSLRSSLFVGKLRRANPMVLPNINKSIDPFRSYLLMIHAPNLLSATSKAAMPSIQVSMKFRHELVVRDKMASVTVQNMPTHNGAQAGPSITIGNPAGDDVITADTADGVQFSIHALDDVFVDGLKGGYGKDSAPSPKEEIKDDSCYDVIAVPMWSNFTAQRYMSSYSDPDADPAYSIGDASSLPYVGDETDDPTCDRRIIPINYPFVVHHVIAAVSYAAPGNTREPTHPKSKTFLNEVGVGIGTGFMGDLFEYQQVAYGKWTPPGGASPKAAVTIDQIKARENGLLSQDSDEPWDYELISIPLVKNGATETGTGYVSQGKPFFIGKATNLYSAAVPASVRRTSCGNVSNVTGIPLTQGCEQFVEVRWAFGDPTQGLLASEDPVVDGIQSSGEIYVGYGGFWVYIIGKKALAGSPDDIPL